MKLKIQADALNQVLQVVTRASHARGLYPAYSLARLEAIPAQGLRLTCFNGEYAITGYAPAQIEKLGDLAVNAATLVEFAKTLQGEIELNETSQQGLQISSASSKAHFVTAEPVIQAVPAVGADGISLRGADVLQLLRVSPYAARDGSRLVLTGARLRVQADGISSLAADGFR